jgi:IPT/TIG domain/Bacterial pre-peptidase C-terminal domain
MDIGSTQSARLRLALVMGLALALAACGGGGTSSSTPNPVPRLDSISPSSTTAGGGLFTLTANGANFISGSVIRWGGASRTTTFLSSTQLTAAVTASDIATSGTIQVTVFNPFPGGGTSGSRTFTIGAAVPLGRNDFCTSGSAAGTTQISNGTIRASFSPYGDVDVYSFQGTAGHQVNIETFAQRLDLDGNSATRDSQADTILELLDGNCSRITSNDDIVMGDMQDSLIQNFTLPSSPGGLYFIRVQDFRGDGRPDLLYDLSLSGAD